MTEQAQDNLPLASQEIADLIAVHRYLSGLPDGSEYAIRCTVAIEFEMLRFVGVIVPEQSPTEEPET